MLTSNTTGYTNVFTASKDLPPFVLATCGVTLAPLGKVIQAGVTNTVNQGVAAVNQGVAAINKLPKAQKGGLIAGLFFLFFCLCCGCIGTCWWIRKKLPKWRAERNERAFLERRR